MAHGGSAPVPRPRMGSPRIRFAVPQQHGAWAFLAVPLVLALALAGITGIGLLFSAAWLLAYPASYYLGRAVVVRWRRGSWTGLARRELAAAVPWMVAAGALALVLVLLRPWLLAVAVILAAAWGVSLWLTRAGHERGVTNDLLLVLHITHQDLTITQQPGKAFFSRFAANAVDHDPAGLLDDVGDLIGDAFLVRDSHHQKGLAGQTQKIKSGFGVHGVPSASGRSSAAGPGLVRPQAKSSRAVSLPSNVILPVR